MTHRVPQLGIARDRRGAGVLWQAGVDPPDDPDFTILGDLDQMERPDGHWLNAFGHEIAMHGRFARAVLRATPLSG